MSDSGSEGMHGTGGTSVVVTRSIRSGREDDFVAWCERARSAAAPFPGFLSASLVSPGPDGPRVFTQTFTFETESQMHSWVDSPQRAEQLAELADIQEGEAQVHFARGMSAWLNLPGQATIVQPPMWKVYVVSFLAIYPLVVIFANYTLLPILYTGPAGIWPYEGIWQSYEPAWFWLNFATLVNTAAINVPMTWVMMPLLTWVFRNWLEKPQSP